MKKHLPIAASLALLCAAVLLSASWGQAPPSAEPVASSAAPSDRYEPGYPILVRRAHASPAQTEISRLMIQLRETDDEAKKADLTKQLQAAVAKYFDEDLKARETELTRLEERLKKARAQLERRSKAKAEIIELQVKVLVNEAEGLGFSAASSLDRYGAGPNVGGQPATPALVAPPRAR